MKLKPKPKKTLTAIITAIPLILLILNSGCYLTAPVSELITPPRLTEEQSDIFAALTNAKGQALTLKYPKTGEHLSAFVFLNEHNVADNTDSVERVMVFYVLTDVSAATVTEPTIWLTFLEKSLDKGERRWKCTNDLTFYATEIEKVEFSRLGDSKENNIVISYSITNRPDKNLRVLTFDNKDGKNQPITVYQRDLCVFYQIDDFDNSGNRRLLSINRNAGEETATVTVEFAGWKNHVFSTLYTLNANPMANEYVKSLKGHLLSGTSKNINTDNTNVMNDTSVTEETAANTDEPSDETEPVESAEPGETTAETDNGNNRVPPLYSEPKKPRSALFLEYTQTDTLCNTGIIVWEDIQGESVPRNIVLTANEERRRENLALLEKRPNLLTAHAYARDIDGSGEINVAGNRPFPGYDHDLISTADRVRAAVWYRITEDNGFEELYYTYLSVNDDYVFFFPDEWVGNVTVTVTREENDVVEVIFWEYDALNFTGISDIKKPVLKIASVAKGASAPSSGYSRYDGIHNERFDYYINIVDKSVQKDVLSALLKGF